MCVNYFFDNYRNYAAAAIDTYMERAQGVNRKLELGIAKLSSLAFDVIVWERNFRRKVRGYRDINDFAALGVQVNMKPLRKFAKIIPTRRDLLLVVRYLESGRGSFEEQVKSKIADHQNQADRCWQQNDIASEQRWYDRIDDCEDGKKYYQDVMHNLGVIDRVTKQWESSAGYVHRLDRTQVKEACTFFDGRFLDFMRFLAEHDPALSERVQEFMAAR